MTVAPASMRKSGLKTGSEQNAIFLGKLNMIIEFIIFWKSWFFCIHDVLIWMSDCEFIWFMLHVWIQCNGSLIVYFVIQLEAAFGRQNCLNQYTEYRHYKLGARAARLDRLHRLQHSQSPCSSHASIQTPPLEDNLPTTCWLNQCQCRGSRVNTQSTLFKSRCPSYWRAAEFTPSSDALQ